ncbi:MAG TPA: hypothetical protein VF128_15080 [Gemmatimonadaceae bacterium]
MRRMNAFRTDAIAGPARIGLIERSLASPPRSLAAIIRLHDALLYLRAFPDSLQSHRAAMSACAAFPRLLRDVAGTRHRTRDTGIVGTVSRVWADFALAEWLCRSYSNEVEIDWSSLTDTSAIDGLLRPIVQRAEEDAVYSGELSTRQWLALRRGKATTTDLSLLVNAAPTDRVGRRVFAASYDAAEVPLRWKLANSSGSATHNTLGSRPVRYRRELRRAPVDPIRFIREPSSDISLLARRRANEVIHVARAALAARGREVYAMTYANPSEVYLADLGEGTAVAVVGVLPEYRMSLEANYGYLMLANGVPIGYGGVTPLYRQANTGLNIFPSFRGGEAAFLWVAALRAFHSLFGVNRFVVNGYQVGEGNPEAIRTAALWFYYRLGFRPSDPKRRTLARREFARLRDRKARTSPDMLRTLSAGDLWLELPGCRRQDYFDEAWLVDCSRRATELLAAQASASPAEAASAISSRIARVLGARGIASRQRSERDAFHHLAPVCALLPGVDRRSRATRAALVRLMFSKGLSQERVFVTMAQRDPCFYPGLIRLLSGAASRP